MPPEVEQRPEPKPEPDPGSMNQHTYATYFCFGSNHILGFCEFVPETSSMAASPKEGEETAAKKRRGNRFPKRKQEATPLGCKCTCIDPDSRIVVVTPERMAEEQHIWVQCHCTDCGPDTSAMKVGIQTKGQIRVSHAAAR